MISGFFVRRLLQQKYSLKNICFERIEIIERLMYFGFQTEEQNS